MTTSRTSSQTSRLMLDHPGWFTTPDGHAQRALRSGATEWVITCHQVDTTFEPTVEIVRQGSTEVDTKPLINCFDPDLLPTPFRLTPTIRDYGRLHRVRSTDLWESTIPSLLRGGAGVRSPQVIQRYRRLCTTIGGSFTTSLGTVLTPPRPETIATASSDDWGELATLPWTHPLRRAAQAYLEHQDSWSHLPSDLLQDALCTLPHIGKQSAAAITADLTNEFDRYEFVDFGTPGRWDQFCHELDGTYSPLDFQKAWDQITSDQRSILAALSIDWTLRRFDTARKMRIK